MMGSRKIIEQNTYNQKEKSSKQMCPFSPLKKELFGGYNHIAIEHKWVPDMQVAPTICPAVSTTTISTFSSKGTIYIACF